MLKVDVEEEKVGMYIIIKLLTVDTAAGDYRCLNDAQKSISDPG